MARELTRITYVEDEPDIREVTQIALEKIGGFTLDICVNGLEAVAKTPAFEPDLILLDVMMPGMDGVETYQQLRRIPGLIDTPIIFMTAKAQPQELEQYTALGCAGVITKPFDPMTLSDEIQGLWDRQH